MYVFVFEDDFDDSELLLLGAAKNPNASNIGTSTFDLMGLPTFSSAADFTL